MLGLGVRYHFFDRTFFFFTIPEIGESLLFFSWPGEGLFLQLRGITRASDPLAPLRPYVFRAWIKATVL